MPHPVSIVIYLHICQDGCWEIPFDMIMLALKSNGLYDNCVEIRVGVVNNVGHIIPNVRLKDPKIVTVVHAPSAEYERPTLLHLHKHSLVEDCQYLYLHTKGIRHISGNNEHTKNCVLDWIKLLIHFNINNWCVASNKLMSNDVYGCEFFYSPQAHFSGNFWWANSHFIRTLPNHIGPEYCDPEFWLFKRDKVIWCNIYSSGLNSGGDHYVCRIIKGIHYK
jgi:hypothetical protein